MAKKKVFICFDFENDKTLKDFIIGQAKNMNHHSNCQIFH